MVSSGGGRGKTREGEHSDSSSAGPPAPPHRNADQQSPALRARLRCGPTMNRGTACISRPWLLFVFAPGVCLVSPIRCASQGSSCASAARKAPFMPCDPGLAVWLSSVGSCGVVDQWQSDWCHGSWPNHDRRPAARVAASSKKIPVGYPHECSLIRRRRSGDVVSGHQGWVRQT